MKLLYAEDEPAMSEAVTDILTYHNYSVDAVYDGADALAYALSETYDGIILDVMMPKMSGLEVLRRLREAGCRTPVLLLTAKSEVEDIRGVDVTANLKTLMDLQLIRLVGRSELPGHPFLYGTTPLFLEHFGLASLQQLNELDPTLQRSNPRQKAEQYRKEKKNDDDSEKTEVAEPPAAVFLHTLTYNKISYHNPRLKSSRQTVVW